MSKKKNDLTLSHLPSSFLKHHGISGMHWGVKNGPPYPLDKKVSAAVKAGKNGSSSLSDVLTKYFEINDKGYNLDKWGSNKDNNILFVTGLSGSGKSTYSNEIRKATNSKLISLDLYYDDPRLIKYQDKSFNQYLKKHVPDFNNKVVKNYDKYSEISYSDDSKLNTNEQKLKDEYWTIMDNVRDALFTYAEDSYPKTKIIVEGAQLIDTSLWTNIRDKTNALYGKPLVIKGTTIDDSVARRIKRDAISDKDYIQTIIDMEKYWQTGLNDLENSAIRKGKKFVFINTGLQ